MNIRLEKQGKITIRPAVEIDLDQINHLITASIAGWNLSERVKRLALSSYHYKPDDFKHFELWVAQNDNNIAGIIALDKQLTSNQKHQSALLVHGLYVLPECQRQHIGSQLIGLAHQRASDLGAEGILLKAIRDAENFFSAIGMKKQPVIDSQRDYDRSYWQACPAKHS
jgi:predicted N-acetyltransferase YhbS